MRRITPCKENDSTSGVQPDNGVGSGRINPNVLNSGPHISVEVVTGRCANSREEKRRKKTLCYEESFSISFFPPPLCSGVSRVGLGCSNPPPRNSEVIGGVLDRMSKKNRRLDFFLYFTVFSYGCDLLNKGYF